MRTKHNIYEWKIQPTQNPRIQTRGEKSCMLQKAKLTRTARFKQIKVSKYFEIYRNCNFDFYSVNPLEKI